MANFAGGLRRLMHGKKKARVNAVEAAEASGESRQVGDPRGGETRAP
jgi:hypothetical protein